MDRMKDYDKYTRILIYNIVSSLKGRETVLLGKSWAFRGIKAHNKSYLDKNLNRFGFSKKEMNIYYSLARLKNMPQLGFNLKKRKKQRKEFFDNYGKYVEGFDIGLDFDNHDKSIKGLTKAFNDTKKIKDYFDNYKVPYELKCSGSGFHININSYVLDGLKEYELETISRKIKFYQSFVYQLKMIFNLETLDESICDLQRIWKVPYSYDIKSGNIALPLTDNQFSSMKNSFDVVKPKNVIKNVKLFRRGLLERNSGNIKGFISFCNDYIEKLGEKDW